MRGNIDFLPVQLSSEDSLYSPKRAKKKLFNNQLYIMSGIAIQTIPNNSLVGHTLHVRNREIW